jgi:hypothetical protein
LVSAPPPIVPRRGRQIVLVLLPKHQRPQSKRSKKRTL